MSYPTQTRFFKFFEFIITLITTTTFVVATFVYIDQYKNGDTIRIQSSLSGGKVVSQVLNNGLRSPKINVRFEEPKDITSQIEYKDVKLISTSSRAFSETEILQLKTILDIIPQKLFDYRPWAIISTDFASNPVGGKKADGVAFSSGPYVYVSDITFRKQSNMDTGTFRGLMRIISHEITHVAQFFETSEFSEEYSNSLLEHSTLVKDWVSKTDWTYKDGKWNLPEDAMTTDYGKTNPVEDMADSVGAMVIGEETSLSIGRIDWVLSWINTDKNSLYQGTIPLSTKIKQRRVENTDNSVLTKYKDPNALTQDIMNFQSTVTISKKDFANFYAEEFKKRGWTGSITTNGVGELTFGNKFKVNLEMDSNPLRVVTLIYSVY